MLPIFCKHKLEERTRTPLEIIYVCAGGCGGFTKVSIACEHQWVPKHRAEAEPITVAITVEDLAQLSEESQADLLQKMCGSVDVLLECTRCHVFHHAKLTGRTPPAEVSFQ